MWEDKHYWTEVYRHGLERMFRIMTQDNLLTNFARGFKGPRDERGLKDAGPPTWWVDEFLKVQGKAAKEAGATNIGGYTLQFDADTGNLTIIGPGGNVQFLQADLLAVLAFIMQGPPDAMPVQSTQQAAYEFSPQLKERQQRAMEALEKFAVASSKAYPKGK